MIHHLRITTLVENTVSQPGLLAEHGLAFWIEADGLKLLFDTGQGMALVHNAEALGIDLGAVDNVAISHGHFDHTGGLAAHPDLMPRATVFVHPDAFLTRYTKRDHQPARSIGWAYHRVDDLIPNVQAVVLTPVPTLVAEGIWLTGQIPRTNQFEDTGGRFSLDEAGTMPDPIHDDQALYIETRRGLVVLMGCGHAGLVNTLDHIGQITGRTRVHAVIGGMHLLEASEHRIAKTITVLQDFNVQVVAPVHCTGLPATAALMESWPDGFYWLTTGSSLTIH